MEDRSQEQRELIVFKKTTVRLDHLIEHYSVLLELNWLCVFCSSRPSCLKAGLCYPPDLLYRYPVDKC